MFFNTLAAFAAVAVAATGVTSRARELLINTLHRVENIATSSTQF